MKWVVAAVLALGLGGCGLFEKLPPVEVCVLYNGKKFCAVKRDGVWQFTVELTPEEKAEVVKLLEQ